MVKNITIALSVVFGTIIASSSIYAHEMKVESTMVVLQSSEESVTYLSANFDKPVVNSGIIFDAFDDAAPKLAAVAEVSSEKAAAETNISEEKVSTEETEQTTVTVMIKPKTKTILSRGGEAPVGSTAAKKTSGTKDLSKYSGKKVEKLDWWKSGNSAFPIGSVVTVKDVYTGKTFRIKRTMGSNHADCEALTTEDTQIIKNIWGGFSWDVRPIHIYINGRILAASMSSQPHAGVDAAPAFAAVRNRSEGYGAGQNLDVVKDNGMNGHFDVHFLNSTRHKDGDEDSRHQSAIRVAASR